MIRSINVVLRKFPMIDNVIICSDGGSWRNNVEIPKCLQREEQTGVIVDYKGTRVRSTDINWELIFNSYNDLIELFNYFDNCTDTILRTIVPLYHSPYPKEYLINVVSEWYEQVEHTHPENVFNFINRYYEQEDTNKWFFSLINKLDDETKDEYKAKYCHHSIDFSININNSKWSYQDVKKRTYTLPGIVNLFNDLRGCIGVIDDIWYLKTTTKEG